MERILVIGGTGRITRTVVQALVQAGYLVRVLSRRPQQAQALLPEEIECYRGDLQDQASLASAIQGVDAVYINLPETSDPKASFIPEVHGLDNILATVPSNVLLIKVSEIDAAENHHFADLTFKFRGEAKLQASGRPFVIFRPTWFMESLPLILTRGRTLMYAGRQPSPLYWIAARDFGKQVTKALQCRSQAQNQVFTVQGPEALTFAQAAKRYIQGVGGNLRMIALPLWILRLSGMFDAQSRADYQLMAHYNRRIETFQAQHTWEMLGRPTTTLEEFAAAWQGQTAGH